MNESYALEMNNFLKINMMSWPQKLTFEGKILK